MSPRPTIHLMVGLPYSGKSTYIRNHPSLSALTVVDSDSYIEKKANERKTSYNAIFDALIDEATTYRDWLAEVCFKKDRSFVVDQTNLTKATRAPLVEAARKHGYRIVAYDFQLPADESQLLARRTQRSDKVIPISVLAEMIASHERPNEEEGFTEIIHINGYGD